MTAIQHPSHSLIKSTRWAAAGIGVMLLANAIYKEATRFRVSGKVILITGSSRGLGLVLARELASRGAKVAICARDADKLELARQELEKQGAEVFTSPMDITDPDQVNTLLHDVVKHFGRIDALINNAGIMQVGPQENMEISDFEDAMKVNYFGPLYAIKAAIPYFKHQGEGRIVNITSIGGKIAVPHMLPYTASKFAAVGLSEGLHAELKKDNIHVTTVIPNLMRTGSPRNITLKGDHEAEYAWFKFTGSSPLFSQEAESAAKEIIKSMEYQERQTVLSLTGKLATAVKGIAPGWVSAVMSVANAFLPEPVTGSFIARKGYEAESPKSQGAVNARTDQAAIQNNEL